MGKYTLFENISPEILAREKNIQTYMNRKLNEIMIIKQEACSKARTYMLEVCRELIFLFCLWIYTITLHIKLLQ